MMTLRKVRHWIGMCDTKCDNWVVYSAIAFRRKDKYPHLLISWISQERKAISVSLA